MQDVVAGLPDELGLRGLEIALRRANSSPGSRVIGQAVKRHVLRQLSAEWDCLPSLIALFGPSLVAEEYTAEDLRGLVYVDPQNLHLGGTL